VFHQPALLALGSSDRLVGAALGLVYGSPPEPPPATGAPVSLRIELTRAQATVDERFLSFALDTSQIAGGHWWGKAADRVEVGRGSGRTEPMNLSRPRFDALARELAPAYLRIGGTEADHVYYSPEAPDKLPDGYELAFTHAHWDATADFAKRSGLELFFTANAGPGPRDDSGAWSAQNLAGLLEHARRRGDRVPVWELGNEVNAYWFTHGVRHHVSGEQYAADLRRFSDAVKRAQPDARIVGPAGFLWPVMGEPLAAQLGIYEQMLQAGGGETLDAITWHFYPQQSRRCPMATRRAAPDVMLNPVSLDEYHRWADYLSELRDRLAPGTPLWLGETGNAQCGGEPGVSDRFASSLWWLDQLGASASRGEQVVVRQTLAGSHYGLIEDESLEPRPDYFTSVMHKRLMGTRVLSTETRGENPYVRSYAHCTPERFGAPAGAVTLLAINVDTEHSAEIRIEEALLGSTARLFQVTAPALDSAEIRLNGRRLEVDASGRLGPLEPAEHRSAEPLRLSPASAAFVVFPDAQAPVCGHRA